MRAVPAFAASVLLSGCLGSQEPATVTVYRPVLCPEDPVTLPCLGVLTPSADDELSVRDQIEMALRNNASHRQCRATVDAWNRIWNACRQEFDDADADARPAESPDGLEP